MGIGAIIGGIGALASGAGALRSGARGQQSSATMQPWKPAQQPLRNNLREAAAMYNAGGFRTDPYAGERVAPYSAMTMGGINQLGGIQGASPLMRSTLDEMMSGETMYRDFDTIRQNVADRTKASLASTFSGGGVNSGLAQDTYSRAIGGALADVEYGAYGDAQNRRLAAVGLAPSLQGMDMTAAGARLTGGGLLDDLAQRRINADMDFQRETQDADMEALMRYSGLVQGIGGMGGQNSMRQPTSMQDWGNMASGFGTALSAASTLFGNRTPNTTPQVGQPLGGR
jgi:hypothetical protein